MGETAQCLRRCIALPDEIDVTEADVDRLARKYLDGDVVQHAVSHIDRVVQTEQAARRRMLAREILEHALAADAGLGVFAGRIGGDGFVRALAADGDERIDASGRERNDARTCKGLRDHRGDVRVHRPGQRQVAFRAKLVSGHEDDVRRLRQLVDGNFVEQIAAQRFNAAALQPPLCARLTEARHADDAALGQSGFRQSGKGRPHLARHAEDHNVAVDLVEVVDQRLGGPAQQLVKGGDIGNAVRQIVAREQHVYFPFDGYCSRTSLTTNSRSRPSTRP